MSNLRNKSKEIYDAGVAQRGEFNPSGVPLLMWKYWAKNAKPKKVPARENFCHFWRVVAIWAPLMFLRVWVDKNSQKIEAILGVLALGALITACVLSTNVLQTVGIILATVAVVALSGLGLIGGVSLALKDDGARFRADLPSGKEAKWFSLFLPTSIPAFLITKFINSSLVQNNKENWAVGLIVTFALAILATATATISYWVPAFLVGAALLGVVLAFFVKCVVARIGDMLAGKRAIADARRQAYYRGELTEEEYYGPKAVPSVPSKFELKVRAIFVGIGDFIILAAQVIRVNKWKICPTVDISK